MSEPTHYRDMVTTPFERIARLCNCASCGRELINVDSAATLVYDHGYDPKDLPAVIRGRINGRPFCWNCLGVPRTIRL